MSHPDKLISSRGDQIELFSRLHLANEKDLVETGRVQYLLGFWRGYCFGLITAVLILTPFWGPAFWRFFHG